MLMHLAKTKFTSIPLHNEYYVRTFFFPTPSSPETNTYDNLENLNHLNFDYDKFWSSGA